MVPGGKSGAQFLDALSGTAFSASLGHDSFHELKESFHRCVFALTSNRYAILCTSPKHMRHSRSPVASRGSAHYLWLNVIEESRVSAASSEVASAPPYGYNSTFWHLDSATHGG